MFETRPIVLADAIRSLYDYFPVRTESALSGIEGRIGDPDTDTRKHADLVFHQIITPALEKVRKIAADFEQPVRSDHLPHPGNILNQILERISRDDLCIAVLTDQRPNVYYELGVAHTMRRRVLQLLDKTQISNMPFDIAALRTVAASI
jgi:hypothetical protein